MSENDATTRMNNSNSDRKKKQFLQSNKDAVINKIVESNLLNVPMEMVLATYFHDELAAYVQTGTFCVITSTMTIAEP